MALNIYTTDPSGLLKKIKKAIDDEKVVTWSYDSDGDFTHVTSNNQWKGKAWLRPHVKDGYLHMAILGKKDEKLSSEVYAVYHGRFAEMVLVHFDNSFTTATATAGKSGNDNF